MSEINALEELRTLSMVRMDGWLRMDTQKIADNIEAEIAERFCEIPVDSNGVPCKCGDEVRLTGENERLMVCGYTVDTDGFVSLYCSKLEDGRRWFPTVMKFATEVKHAKPRTLESVLADLANEVWEASCTCQTTWSDSGLDGIEKRYADEIRSLIGGEDA